MKNIILIGMPASGKTTVAYLCAKTHNVRDTDKYIESLHGSISEIFEKYGEEHFRKLETDAVRAICKEKNCLISTGGGCVMRDENVQILKNSGKIVYLRAKEETLLKRLEGDGSRPLLAGNRAERLAELFKKRAPVYERVADIIVDTDGLTPEEVLEKIFDKIGRE